LWNFKKEGPILKNDENKGIKLQLNLIIHKYFYSSITGDWLQARVREQSCNASNQNKDMVD